jgi:hypothetical protein
MNEGTHPGFLKYILSVVHIANNFQDRPKYHFSMAPAQFGIGSGLPMLRRSHQLRIARCRSLKS